MSSDGRVDVVGPVEVAELKTVRETAERLHRSVSTVRRMIRSGDLPVVRIGHGRGRPGVPESAITDYLTRATTPQSR